MAIGIVVAILALLGIGMGAAVMLGAPARVLAATGHEIVAGTVTNVAGNDITVKSRQAQTVVTVDANTWVFVDGKETTAADIKTNMQMTAAGTKTGDKLAAGFVFAHSRRAPAARPQGPGQAPNGQMMPRRLAYGTVKGLSGDTLTVTTLQGTDRQVTLTAQTVIEQPNGKDLDRSALTAGTKVFVLARPGANNAAEVQRIVVLPQDFNPGQRWHRGQNGQNGGQMAPQGPRGGFPGSFEPARPGVQSGPTL